MSEFILTDEEIVIRVIGGDIAIFEELVVRYEDKLRRYLLRFGIFVENIPDILQEVFIKVYLNINAFDSSLKFSSWIYRITHNEAINFIRKNKNGPISFNDEETDDFISNIVDENVDIEKTFDQNNLKDLAMNIMNKMPQKYKDVMILKYFEEKSYEEISDILKMPISTVGTYMTRGKALFKDAYISFIRNNKIYG